MSFKQCHQTVQRLLVLSAHVNQKVGIQLSTSSPVIELSATKVLIDEKIQIKICGLRQGQKITLQTYLTESDKTFGACGHYVADLQGIVDTFRDSSFGGTFEGVEPMGLFWSMKTTPGVKPGRLIKADVMVPFDVTLAVQDGFWEFEGLRWSDSHSSLVSCKLQRTYAGPGVKRIPCTEKGLYGTLFLPPGEGPFPAVIDLYGLSGGIVEYRSALLASRGFASFAIAFVDYEDLPRNEMSLDFGYFLRAFDWLASHPLIDPKCLGGIAICGGCGYLQLIASKRPALKCLVNINGSGVPIGTEQTVEGEQIKTGKFNFERIALVNGMASFKEMYIPGDSVSFCPSWRHGAKHLVVHGLDDQCVNPAIMNTMKAHLSENFKENYIFLAYSGAGHLIDPPYAPLCRSNYNAILKKYLLWGGQPEQHAKAEEQSWSKILEFLNQNLHRTKLQSSLSH